MKLGDARDGVVYCTRGLEVGTWSASDGFEARGRLTPPLSGRERLRFEAVHARASKRLLRPLVGRFATANVWPLSDGDLLATAGRWVFASTDGGRTWDVVHELPTSSGPKGVLPTSVCEHQGRVYLAEYPLGSDPARVFVSDDRGHSWSTVIISTDVRHFHGLFTDPVDGGLWATSGDADAQSAIGRLADGEFRPVGRGSQRWRAVSLAFTDDAVYWGVDCSFADEIEILRLPRSEFGSDDPEVERLATVDSTVHYAATYRDTDRTWLFFSTASSSAVDRFAPEDARRNVSGPSTRVIASSSASDFRDWREICSVPRRDSLGERTDRLPATAAYTFLATDPELGLLVNPYNVARGDGQIFSVGPSRLATLYDEGAAR